MIGGRQADDIVAWLKKKTGPPAVEITSAEQAKKISSTNNVAVFGFFTDKESEKSQAFLTVAGLIDDQIFAIVSDEKVIKELEAEDEDMIIFKNVSNIVNIFVFLVFLLYFSLLTTVFNQGLCIPFSHNLNIILIILLQANQQL